MPWYDTNALLYLALIASAYYAYYNVPDTLNHIRNLAACPEVSGPGPRKQLQKDAENAINIETLRTLSDGHSYDLRASTIKIIGTRTVKSRTKKLLLKDLASKDEDTRYKAICGLWLLLNNPAFPGNKMMTEFLDYQTFHALITALTNVLADHKSEQSMYLLARGDDLYPEPQIPPSPVRPPVRPSHELSLMWMLRELLTTPRPSDKHFDHPDNITCALHAGLVKRWLKHYPFPCSLPQNSKYNYKKSDVVSLFEHKAWEKDDEAMRVVIREIERTALGKKQLREAGLRGSTYLELDEIEGTIGRWRHFPTRLDTERDIRMTNGESTAGAATPPPILLDRQQRSFDIDRPRARSQGLSPREETVRRRRREAVVVAEPGTELNLDNILQRTDSGSSWHADATETGEDDVGGSDGSGSIVLSAGPTQAMSYDSDFMWLLLPLRRDQRLLEQVQEAAIHGEESNPESVLSGLERYIGSIQEQSHNIADEIRGWNASEAEQEHYLDRLAHLTGEIVNGRRNVLARQVLEERVLQALRAQRSEPE